MELITNDIPIKLRMEMYSVNDYQMREELKKAYSTDTWWEKVSKMTSEQVAAVYLSFKKKGKV